MTKDRSSKELDDEVVNYDYVSSDDDESANGVFADEHTVPVNARYSDGFNGDADYKGDEYETYLVRL